MTLPASPNKIGYSDVNVEIGQPAAASLAMSWIKDNSKATANGATGTITSLGGLRGLSYYKSNMFGNCNNDNCTEGEANCGDHNCQNCYNSALADCLNCDSQKYIQPGKNCDPTYNCNSNQVSLNCNCDCDIWCPCW